MKRLALILCLVSIVSLFGSCTNETSNSESTVIESVSETQLQNVVIRVKKDLVDETTFLTYVSEFEGLKITSDGDFHILTMSQETYTELLKSRAQMVYDAHNLMIADDGIIEDFEYGADFRTVKVLVNRAAFDGLTKDTQRLQLISIGAQAMGYQIFLTEGQKTTVTAVYSDTKEEAMIISLPIKA